MSDLASRMAAQAAGKTRTPAKAAFAQPADDRVRTTIYLTKGELKALKVAAAEADTTMTALIAEALQDVLTRHRGSTP